MKKILFLFWILNFLSLLSQVDSTSKPTSIKLSNPKYEIYAKYFDPFTISDNNASLDFGFKFQKNDFRYFNAKLIYRSFPNQSKYGIGSFGLMWRLTHNKVPWVHFELASNLSLSYRVFSQGIIYDVKSIGAGILFYSEIQFDVGPFLNLTIGSNICPQICYNSKQLKPEFPNGTPPTNNFSFPIYVLDNPILVVGFNFCIFK